MNRDPPPTSYSGSQWRSRAGEWSEWPSCREGGEDGGGGEGGERGGGWEGRGGVREKIQYWGEGDSLFCLAAECKETHPNLMSIMTSQMMATKISHENRPMRAFLSPFVCARQRGRGIYKM